MLQPTTHNTFLDVTNGSLNEIIGNKKTTHLLFCFVIRNPEFVSNKMFTPTQSRTKCPTLQSAHLRGCNLVGDCDTLKELENLVAD